MNIKEQLKLLDKIKQEIKSSKTVKKIFKEAEVDLDIIDLVPMCFADLEVSARTQHGIIYFNKNLLKNQEEISHYMVHELTHILQQCFSGQATVGSNANTYLDNKYEQEGFQNQTKFIAETEGKEEAKEYIDKVLEHHDVPSKEKEDKRDALLSYASDEFEKESKRRKEKLNRMISILYSDTPKKFSKEDLRELSEHVNMLSDDPEYSREFQEFSREMKEKNKSEEERKKEQRARDLYRKHVSDALEGSRNVLRAIEENEDKKKK